MRAALPHMRARGWGRVINVCSLNGVNAHMGTLEYNAAKEALRALTRTAAREWAPLGVTVNAICPAAKSAAFMRALGDNPDVAAFADAMNPMGRIGDPYLDIAPVALFLASEDCRYLTGNTLFVDGGSHINGVAWAPDLDSGGRLRAGEVAALQPEGAAQPVGARGERDLDRSAVSDEVALFDVGSVVRGAAPADAAGRRRRPEPDRTGRTPGHMASRHRRGGRPVIGCIRRNGNARCCGPRGRSG